MNNNLITNMLKDLKVYGGCSVCIHHDPYKIVNACKLDGCCGGGTSKNKEDLWVYRYAGMLGTGKKK